MNKGSKHSESSKAKVSEKAKQRWLNPDYRKMISEAMKFRGGHKHTEATRKKMSESRKLLWTDPDYRQRSILSTMKPKVWSAEGKKNIGGWARSPEASAFLSDRAKNHPELQVMATKAANEYWAKHPDKRRENGIKATLIQAGKHRTSIELICQESLARAEFTFLTQVPTKFTVMDILLPDSKVAIFADGCYWHNCPLHSPEKRKGTTEKDARITRSLEEEGYKVLRIWEHEIKADHDIVLAKLKSSQQQTEVMNLR